MILNPIVKSPMPYYIKNDSEINQYKYELTLKNIRTAFEKWENATGQKVKFYQVNTEPNEGVIITLVSPSGLEGDTIGEGASIYYSHENYSLIVGGDITLEPIYGSAENLVQIIHEIGHVMGLAHVSNPHSVMYPYSISSAEITNDTISGLRALYQRYG